MSLMLISTNCQLMVPQVPIMGLVFSITITSLGKCEGLFDSLILLSATCIREIRFSEETLSWWCHTLCWSRHPGGWTCSSCWGWWWPSPRHPTCTWPPSWCPAPSSGWGRAPPPPASAESVYKYISSSLALCHVLYSVHLHMYVWGKEFLIDYICAYV